MTPIDQDIIDTFRRNFSKQSDKPMILYGTGDKTKLLLDECTEYHFIGLMDGRRVGSCYGLPILSEEEAASKARMLIIVCNLSSLEIIYQRIAAFADQNNIEVYHISGRKMCYQKDHASAKKLYCDREEYQRAIREHEVISFDLFDTLIMRRCLYPDDLFDIMEEHLSKTNMPQKDFARNRKKAEHDAISKFGCKYTLETIYQRYGQLTNQTQAVVKDLYGLELAYELEYTVARRDVVNLLEYAKALHKKMILVSDMYLTKGQLEQLLKKNGISINYFTDVYISCEAGMAKSDGQLWHSIVESYPNVNILHFGDHPVSDGTRASQEGIHTLHINSGAELAAALLGCRWHNWEKDTECRRLMGLFVSGIFNSPFCLDSMGKIKVETLEEAGFCFFGPVTTYFMEKLYQRAGERQQKILFLARDGWILKKIADQYYSNSPLKTEYVLTSRRAIAIAQIDSNEDIENLFYIFNSAAGYTFQVYLKMIFDIEIDHNDVYRDTIVRDVEKNILLNHLKKVYGKRIIEKSKIQKQLYKKYFETINVNLDDDLAIVNFVGSGITQSFFEKFGFGKQSEFYYFAMTPLNVEMELKSPVYTIFDYGSIYTSKDNPIVEYTVLGECVFSSPASQFMGFATDGIPIYAEDGQNPEYCLMQMCHDGILNFIGRAKTLDIDMKQLPPEFVNSMYGILFDSKLCAVDEKVRRAFRMKDLVKSEKTCNVWAD